MYASTLLSSTGWWFGNACILPAAYLSLIQNVLARHNPQLARNLQNSGRTLRCCARSREWHKYQSTTKTWYMLCSQVFHARQPDQTHPPQPSCLQLRPNTILPCYPHQSQHVHGATSQLTCQPACEQYPQCLALSDSKAGQHSGMQTPGGSPAHQVS